MRSTKQNHRHRAAFMQAKQRKTAAAQPREESLSRFVRSGGPVALAIIFGSCMVSNRLDENTRRTFSHDGYTNDGIAQARALNTIAEKLEEQNAAIDRLADKMPRCRNDNSTAEAIHDQTRSIENAILYHARAIERQANAIQQQKKP